ncbi:MAG: YciI family protein [Thiotrichaceae bacterium]
MAQYLFAYLGGNTPTSPEEGQKHFEKYTQWLTELGSAVVLPTIPLKDTMTVNSDGTVTEGTTTSMSGYTVIEVDSMDAALEAAKACPFLEIGGSLEVSEFMEMG